MMSKEFSEDNLYSRIRKSSIYVILQKSVTPILSFLITIYIVRKLSVTDYGIYNILIAVMGYIALFSSLGLPSIFQRYIPEFHEHKEFSILKELIKKGMAWRFPLIVAFILTVILLSPQLGKLFKIENYLYYFKLFCLGIIFYLESNLLSVALTALFLHKYFAISQILYVLFRATILFFLLHTGWSLRGLLVGEVISYGFLLAIYIYFYYKKFAHKHPDTEKPTFPTKRLLRYGGFSYFNEMGATILGIYTDFFIISAFLGPVAVGIYAFANRITHLVASIMPTRLLQEVIRPTFFTRYTQNNNVKELEKMFNILTKFTAFFFFPLTAGIFILGDKFIIHIFDAKYIDSLKVLWIVASFTALNSFQFPLGLVIQSIEKVEVLLFSKIFAIYNLILDILVIKTFGIIGVALVTGSAVLFKNLYIYIYARKWTHLSIDFKGLGIITLNSLLMVLLVYPFRRLVMNIPSFILIVLIGIVIYLTISYFNKGFSDQERKTINKILPRPVFVF